MTATSPCSICNKNVRKGLCCDICDNWVHLICNILDDKDFKYHQKNPEAAFHCLKCIENSIPFSTLNDNQFNIAVKQGVNYILETGIKYTPIEMDKKIFERTNHAIYAYQNDDDEIDT